MSDEWDSDLKLAPRRDRVEVKISQARPGDANEVAKVFLTSFEHTDGIRLMFPWRQNYYGQELLDKWQNYEAKQLRLRIVSEAYCYTATVTEGKREVIAGFIGWKHDTQPRRRSVWEWILARVIYPVYMYMTGHRALNIDAKMLEVFVDKHKETFGEGGVAHGRDAMYVNILCVAPEWQGRGIASALIDVAMEEAKKKDAVLYLEAGCVAVSCYPIEEKKKNMLIW